jgi:signal transduction histidine kinase
MPAATDLSVLVVDDDTDTRNNLRDILELDNFQVETVGSIAEVLQRRDWDHFSAILLDRRLPDGDAEELLPRLRQLAPEAAILIVTGYADLEDAIAALRQGAADYILKPINADALRVSLARISERRRLKERALQAERLATIGQMMAGLAHESGNALARSQACLEMLAMEVEDRPEALELITRIQTAQNHLQQLYDEVRNYAAPLKLERQMHSVRSVWRQAWSNVADQRHGRTAILREENGAADLVCLVDPFRLEQVFRNIYENALAACKDPVEITVMCAEAELSDRAALRIAVRDNGPGLSAEQRRRIFEPFFTTKTKGTGLGMAIAQRIAEAHGGQILVGAPAGPGAEIQIVLPRGTS